MRRLFRNKALASALLAAACLARAPVAGADESAAFPGDLKDALLIACQPPYDDAQRFRALGPIRVLEHSVTKLGDAPGRAETRFALSDGREISATAFFPGGRLRRIAVELSNPTPEATLTAAETCAIVEARRIDYDADGVARAIRVYAPDLVDVQMEVALNPDVPTAPDPGGVSVGLIDSGVNYLLPDIAARLARDTDGKLVGRDLWDGDDRPYDVDTGRSPFFPLHHGTAVASVLIREAPMARVLPIRYPRPDMGRMADAVDWLSKQGAAIVNLAMGSNSKEEWSAFAEAARRHPEMLFIVSAGNDGRDIDRAPVYPASLTLPNTIVVTSSTLDGRLAQGSNWGASSVDLLVPGERVPVTDHRGAPGKASGSSFAVPRVTALAVRLKNAHPDWHAPELRDAILKRGRPLAVAGQARYGWLPDPTDGP